MPSRWVILAWVNFALAVAAVLKFVPILVSLRHGLVLTPEQIAAVFIPFWFPAAVTSASNLSRAARAWRRARAPA